MAVRAMFGGYGISLNGNSIGLIAEDRLYLRVDDDTRAAFEAAGSAPFVYPSKKGPMTMKNYWALPAERWGRLAVAAAERARARENAKKKKKPAVRASSASSGSRRRAPKSKSR